MPQPEFLLGQPSMGQRLDQVRALIFLTGLFIVYHDSTPATPGTDNPGGSGHWRVPAWLLFSERELGCQLRSSSRSECSNSITQDRPLFSRPKDSYSAQHSQHAGRRGSSQLVYRLPTVFAEGIALLWTVCGNVDCCSPQQKGRLGSSSLDLGIIFNDFVGTKVPSCMGHGTSSVGRESGSLFLAREGRQATTSPISQRTAAWWQQGQGQGQREGQGRQQGTRQRQSFCRDSSRRRARHLAATAASCHDSSFSAQAHCNSTGQRRQRLQRQQALRCAHGTCSKLLIFAHQSTTDAGSPCPDQHSHRDQDVTWSRAPKAGCEAGSLEDPRGTTRFRVSLAELSQSAPGLVGEADCNPRAGHGAVCQGRDGLAFAVGHSFHSPPCSGRGRHFYNRKCRRPRPVGRHDLRHFADGACDRKRAGALTATAHAASEFAGTGTRYCCLHSSATQEGAGFFTLSQTAIQGAYHRSRICRRGRHCSSDTCWGSGWRSSRNVTGGCNAPSTRLRLSQGSLREDGIGVFHCRQDVLLYSNFVSSFYAPVLALALRLEVVWEEQGVDVDFRADPRCHSSSTSDSAMLLSSLLNDWDLPNLIGPFDLTSPQCTLDSAGSWIPKHLFRGLCGKGTDLEVPPDPSGAICHMDNTASVEPFGQGCSLRKGTFPQCSGKGCTTASCDSGVQSVQGSHAAQFPFETSMSVLAFGQVVSRPSRPTAKRVTFDFSVDFWFPEPHPICLPRRYSAACAPRTPPSAVPASECPSKGGSCRTLPDLSILCASHTRPLDHGCPVPISAHVCGHPLKGGSCRTLSDWTFEHFDLGLRGCDSPLQTSSTGAWHVGFRQPGFVFALPIDGFDTPR